MRELKRPRASTLDTTLTKVDAKLQTLAGHVEDLGEGYAKTVAQTQQKLKEVRKAVDKTLKHSNRRLQRIEEALADKAGFGDIFRLLQAGKRTDRRKTALKTKYLLSVKWRWSTSISAIFLTRSLNR